jgi:hypothetical protein
MKEIAAALVKAQKAFGPALKTSTNPHFRSKYAALDACIEAVIDALNNNGIMLMQQTHLCEDGVIVETTFIHESGEMLSGGKLHVPAAKQDPQGYGSALTYAKRYSLQSACGIAPEDDDGNHATASVQQRQAPKPIPKEQQRTAPAAKPAAADPPPKKMEGKPGPWQISVTTEPDGDFKDWAAVVIEATQVALGAATSEADVNSVFRTNKVIYDRLKAEPGSSAYEALLEDFKEAKARLSQEEPAE